MTKYMEFTLETVVFYLLILDSLGANIVAWSDGKKWYTKHLPVFSKHFPLTKGWTAAYLAIVLWIGYLTFK